MIGQRFNNTGAEPRLGLGHFFRSSNAIVTDDQGPIEPMRAVIDQNFAAALAGERMLERIDDKFGDDQPETDRYVRFPILPSEVTLSDRRSRSLIIDAPRLSQSWVK